MSPPPQQSQTKDVTPANIFAQMKSGTFGDDSAPQQPGMPILLIEAVRRVLMAGLLDRYDALRPQPTGWNNGFQQQQPGYGYR
jgi:hypothetical protein